MTFLAQNLKRLCLSLTNLLCIVKMDFNDNLLPLFLIPIKPAFKEHLFLQFPLHLKRTDLKCEYAKTDTFIEKSYSYWLSFLGHPGMRKTNIGRHT